MERITIDLTHATTKDSIHDILISSLELPSYYGRNLDALNDLVSTMFLGKRTEITLIGLNTLPEDIKNYGEKLSKVFSNASKSSCKVSDSTFLMVKEISGRL